MHGDMVQSRSAETSLRDRIDRQAVDHVTKRLDPATQTEPDSTHKHRHEF